MQVDHLILGDFETNCYVLRADDKDKDCVIIDTGLQVNNLLKLLKEKELNPKAVILTHGHADHITGVAALREIYENIKVFIHTLDADMLTRASSNLSMLSGQFFKTTPADELLEDGDIIEQAGLTLEVIHTPGHTKGGICLYLRDENVLFSGDTLFADSVGRTDLPGGNMGQLIEAIHEKLCTLPDKTKVYPGHGPETTIEREKAHNQYLQ